MSESPNERPAGLNPAIVQSGAYTTTSSFTSTTTGVTKTAVNLFNSATATDPIYVIPTNVRVRVNIVYDVETYDPKLVSQYLGDGVTNGSTIENNITAILAEGFKITAGKKHTINLHLGMKSVKVKATVSNWETGGNADVEVPQ